jgi:hypothetical protein
MQIFGLSFNLQLHHPYRGFLVWLVSVLRRRQGSVSIGVADEIFVTIHDLNP